jgi:hypothetical protein
LREMRNVLVDRPGQREAARVHGAFGDDEAHLRSALTMTPATAATSVTTAIPNVS